MADVAIRITKEMLSTHHVHCYPGESLSDCALRVHLPVLAMLNGPGRGPGLIVKEVDWELWKRSHVNHTDTGQQILDVADLCNKLLSRLDRIEEAVDILLNATKGGK